MYSKPNPALLATCSTSTWAAIYSKSKLSVCHVFMKGIKTDKDNIFVTVVLKYTSICKDTVTKMVLLHSWDFIEKGWVFGMSSRD